MVWFARQRGCTTIALSRLGMTGMKVGLFRPGMAAMLIVVGPGIAGMIIVLLVPGRTGVSIVVRPGIAGMIIPGMLIVVKPRHD